ncbi:glycoside hydrolase family 26 protein [Wenyingzhuangia sp. IMCC45574]
MLRKYLIVLLVISVYSCKSLYTAEYQKPKLVDEKLSKRTKKLHKQLFMLSQKGFAVGHQDATAYGVGWKYNSDSESGKGDVKTVTGKQPAVYGFDLGHIEIDADMNLDSIPFNTMKKLIIDAYKNGGIITLSWHLDNPVTGGSSWDNTPAVKDIIGEGVYKEKFNLWLKRVALFIKDLKYRGKKIPVIFRPYHEMNGNWFWWGNPSCTAKEYKQLWRETVTILRDEYKLHNIMYAYSPNSLKPNDDYLRCYPGDDYVDFFGVDTYDRNNTTKYIKALKYNIGVVKKVATEKNKLYAFTETGLEKIGTENWFTEVFYPNIKDEGISWVLFWRNAHKGHHYLPYKSHKSAEDFKKFSNLPKTLFLKDINKDK